MENRVSSSVVVRLVYIIVMMILLMVPTFWTRGILNERQDNAAKVADNINESWGKKQSLSTPIISIPIVTSEIKDKKIEQTYNIIYVAPKENNISCLLDVISLQRGIYKQPVYNSSIKMEGSFACADIKKAVNAFFKDYKAKAGQYRDVDWEQIKLIFPIKHIKGVQEKPILIFDEKIVDDLNIYESEYERSSQVDENFSELDIEQGFSINLDGFGENCKEDDLKNYSFEVKLKGSQGIYFSPVGENSNVFLTGNWDSPSFVGLSANERSISKDSFEASWKIFSNTKPYYSYWDGYLSNSNDNPFFGSDMKLSVDHYHKSDRMIKYAFIFILFIFTIFFFIEILGKKRIHPIQYLLVGLSVVIFYVLLLALSEHIGFSWGYGVSAVAVTTLIYLYSLSIFSSKRQSLIMLCLLLMMYIFMFVVIQLEDFALLVGSLGIFAALTMSMYLSRKVNWYEIE